ncbi:MAG TPA: hypothetical protein VFK31_02785 [Rhodanobacteraceae bacterium]|nr:hypothetical protein [Rhodanobacteraceae bacterium]
MPMKILMPTMACAAGALLLSGAAMAQTFTPVAPATTGTTSSPANGHDSVTFQAANGSIVTIKSRQPPRRSSAPPPAFVSLDTNGNGSIDVSEAAAYPPLANDFGYADSSHDKAVSKSEYARWVKQP